MDRKFVAVYRIAKKQVTVSHKPPQSGSLSRKLYNVFKVFVEVVAKRLGINVQTVITNFLRKCL